jgi:hypothetical protein
VTCIHLLNSLSRHARTREDRRDRIVVDLVLEPGWEVQGWQRRRRPGGGRQPRASPQHAGRARASVRRARPRQGQAPHGSVRRVSRRVARSRPGAGRRQVGRSRPVGSGRRPPGRDPPGRRPGAGRRRDARSRLLVSRRVARSRPGAGSRRVARSRPVESGRHPVGRGHSPLVQQHGLQRAARLK